jgi:tetratricopeptide (TPR) repeat protein
MKYTKIILLFVIATAALMTACKLQVDPLFDTPNELVLKTGLDVEAALNGAYSKMQREEALGGFYTLFPDLISDYVQVVDRDIAGDFRVYQRNLYGVGVSTYRTSYQAINIANNVIEAIDNNAIEPSEFYTANKNRMKGEALFVRAIMHFELVRLFGYPYGVPQATQEQSGIIIKLKPDRGRGGAARSTTVQVYEQIEKDLREAIALLPEDYDGRIHPRSYRGRATKYAAMGYLAKVLFQKSENTTQAWQAIVDICNDVLNTGKFTLDEFDPLRLTDGAPLNKTGYAAAKETIFQIVNMELNSTTGPILSRYRSRNESTPQYARGRRFDEARMTDVQTITLPNGTTAIFADRRVNAYFTSVSSQGRNLTAIQKYYHDFTNISKVRAAELHLIRAEAYFWLGNFNLAATDVDLVRKRSLKNAIHALPSLTINPDNTIPANQIKAIRDEYRREMCYEGIFLHEYVRQNILDDLAGTDYAIIKEFTNADNGRTTGNPPRPDEQDARDRFRIIRWDDDSRFCYIIPIPDAELFANPALKPIFTCQ